MLYSISHRPEAQITSKWPFFMRSAVHQERPQNYAHTLRIHGAGAQGTCRARTPLAPTPSRTQVNSSSAACHQPCRGCGLCSSCSPSIGVGRTGPPLLDPARRPQCYKQEPGDCHGHIAHDNGSRPLTSTPHETPTSTDCWYAPQATRDDQSMRHRHRVQMDSSHIFSAGLDDMGICRVAQAGSFNLFFQHVVVAPHLQQMHARRVGTRPRWFQLRSGHRLTIACGIPDRLLHRFRALAAAIAIFGSSRFAALDKLEHQWK